MRAETVKECKRGFTIVELIVVVSIVAILTFVAISTFREMIDKYQVESKTKEMFSAIMEARGRALQRSRIVFVLLLNNAYEVYEDTDPAPEGNGFLEVVRDGPGGDKQVISETLKHNILAPFAAPDMYFRFERTGIASAAGYIRIEPRFERVRPDYDCINIGQTRVKMGQFDKAGGSCVEK